MVVINRSARCLIRLLILLCAPDALADIAPFTSDGCSAFPDGTPSQKTLWLECCYEHDYAYWKGGTREERAEADQALRACVEADWISKSAFSEPSRKRYQFNLAETSIF